MGFVKASELVPSTATPHVNGSDSTPQLPTAFIPASKLVFNTCSSAITNLHSSATADGDHSNKPQRRNRGDGMKTDASPSTTDDKGCSASTSRLGSLTHDSCPSTSGLSNLKRVNHGSSSGMGSLRRVKVDLHDLYTETSSDEDADPAGHPVSGPGMGFQLASSLCTMPSSLTACSVTASSGKTSSVACSSARPPTVGESGAPRGGVHMPKSSTGHTKPLPKITNFFEK